jgi:hypothetical protein
MNSYGIQGKLMKWFENYLFKRRQKVFNTNSWSSFEPVSAGVPQGSVLVNKTFVPNLVESFRKIAKDEAVKFVFSREFKIELCSSNS